MTESDYGKRTLLPKGKSNLVRRDGGDVRHSNWLGIRQQIDILLNDGILHQQTFLDLP